MVKICDLKTTRENFLQTMETYVKQRLVTAKNLLETGVEMQQPQSIVKAINLYKEVSQVAKSKPELYENVVKNMIRACTVMCVYDAKNAKLYLDEAAKYDPNDPTILNNLGFVYHTQYSDWDKSVSHYEKCLSRDPTYSTAYLGIMDVYRTLRHHKLELEYAKKGAKHCPDSPEILNSLALAMLHTQDHKNIKKMLEILNLALSKDPSSETASKLFVNIGHIHGIRGDFSTAVGYYLKALEADDKHQPAYQNILLNLHYFSDKDFSDHNLFDTMKRFQVIRRKKEGIASVITRLSNVLVKKMYGATFPEQPKFNADVARKLNVGFISADFVDHAVSHFISAIFQHYNANAYNVYIYANNVYDSEAINKIRCTGYRSVLGVSSKDVVSQMKKDELDILVDLSSHTSGNRLDVIALRPAPVVLSYCGYPDDTGFPFVKRISDAFTERCNPKQDGEISPIDLGRLFLCYTPKSSYEDYVKRRDEKNITSRPITFGSFAKLQKINQHVIEAWMEILSRVPNSRLILKSKYFADPETLQTWKNKFKRGKTDFSKRVLFMKGGTAEEHMKSFKLLDIQLDTFPYSGTTITTESLYMNVPVVTLALEARGVGHVSRVSGSILHSMNMDEDCVAKNVNEYVAKAVALAKKLPEIPNVREIFLNCEISNHKDFTAKFEKVLEKAFIDQTTSTK